MIDSLLTTKRILITCGMGGVGKTTLSAALALRACQLGRKAVVITIDPAKRLATSLGMETLGDRPTDLTGTLRSILKGAIPAAGSLAAIVPDTRQTLETLFESLAPSRTLANRITNNPIFHLFAREYSGANEYMALARLYALDQSRRYDLIVLDTPPSRQALAFLDAPVVLSRFLEERFIKWLVYPAQGFFSGGMRKALKVLEDLTGSGFISQLFDFATALFEIRLGFTQNLERISSMLREPGTGFTLVCTPSNLDNTEIEHLESTLTKKKFRFEGILVNRTFSFPTDPVCEAAPKGSPLAQAVEICRVLQTRENHAMQILNASGKFRILARLPEFARDIHSVEDLTHVACALTNRNPTLRPVIC